MAEGVKWNTQDAFASAPQERYSFFTHGTFNVADRVTAFARATYAESKTSTRLFGGGVTSGWETTVPYDPARDSPVDPSLNYRDEATVRAILANPNGFANPGFIPTGTAGAHFPVPLEVAVLLNSRANQSARWQPNWSIDESLSHRQTENVNTVWQIETGLDIELPFRDWTAELYYSHGESSTYNVAGGNLSLARVRAITNYPDWGRNAAGYQMRDNAAQFVPDILQSQDSFQDQVIGVYPTGYLDASTKVDDWYVEALVPVLNGITGIQQLELELGARYSDYRETEAQTTWKALVNWQINDWARVRGGFNRATRAPNLGELFLNQQEVFTGGGQFSDPCGVRSNSPYGAGGNTFATDPIQTTPTEIPPFLAAGATQASANSAFLICQALMGPIAAENFYFAGQDVTQPGAGGGFAWVLQEGNRNLQSETSDSWTFGAVLRAPSDNPWLSGLNFTVDWYKVEIEDAIMQYSLDFAQFRCYGTRIVTTPAEAQQQAQTPGCQLMPRDQRSGVPLSTKISYDNQATIETAGFDIGVNWFANLNDLGVSLPGGLGLSLNATVLDYYRTKQSPGVFDPVIEWAGSLGPNLSGTQGGAYDYRLFGNLSYIRDNWSVTLRWRHLPEVDSVGMANTRARMRNNGAVAAGAPGIILNYAPITEQPIGSYNIFDLAANWTVNETISLRAGITNLLDVEPETQWNPGRPTDVPLSSYCEGQAPGCLTPFSYSVPNRGGFNGGYYDTIGRRMFIGVKASF